MKPLLCVRHEPEDDGGLALSTFEAEGLTVLTRDAWERAAKWPGIDEIAGLAVFGGTMNVDQTDRFPFLAHERGLVCESVDRGLPFLGVCLGAQMLARALGQTVDRAPARTLGFTPVHPSEAGGRDELTSVYEDGAMTFHWHEDTFDLPPGAESLLSGEGGSVQAFRSGASAWGVVFHPEVTDTELKGWLEVSDRGTLAAEWGTDPELLRPQIARHLPEHQRRGRELFARFARIVLRSAGA